MNVEVRRHGEQRLVTLTGSEAELRELADDVARVADEGRACELDVCLMTDGGVGMVEVRVVPEDG